MPTSKDFLAELLNAANGNGGRPPGEPAFYRATGWSRKELWAAGFETYGAACEAAGLRSNTLTSRLTDDQLFRPLAALARRQGKFPTKGAFEVERLRNSRFPSWDAYSRRAKRGPQATLREVFASWCASNPEFSDLVELLRLETRPDIRPRTGKPVVNGYVYLMRYGATGRIFKVGHTNDVERRHSQLKMMTPHDVRVVHRIPTDDPEGIEAYWLRRFEAKRRDGKVELFDLTQADVAAFKSRRYQ